jgi:hypothetical protein
VLGCDGSVLSSVDRAACQTSCPPALSRTAPALGHAISQALGSPMFRARSPGPTCIVVWASGIAGFVLNESHGKTRQSSKPSDRAALLAGGPACARLLPTQGTKRECVDQAACAERHSVRAAVRAGVYRTYDDLPIRGAVPPRLDTSSPACAEPICVLPAEVLRRGHARRPQAVLRPLTDKSLARARAACSAHNTRAEASRNPTRLRRRDNEGR